MEAQPEVPIRRWQGNFVEREYRFTFDMKLTIDGGKVQGSIRWTLTWASPRADFANRVGQSATEDISGTFDPSSNELRLKGVRTTSDLIAVDEYHLVLSSSGRSVGGRKKGQGMWENIMSGVGVVEENSKKK